MKNITVITSIFFAFVIMYATPLNTNAADLSGYLTGGYDGGDGGYYSGGYDGGDGGYYSGGYDDFFDGYLSGGYDGGDYGYYTGGYDGGYYSGGYDYGCGWSCYDYYPSYSYDYGCGSWCGGYSTWIPSVSQPARSSGGYTNVNTNTITNTNVNNVTNIDNSIRDSFNTVDSYNTSLVVAQPQTSVVYTQPAPYCTINHALVGGYGYGHVNTGAYLSWSSTNAVSAFLSNVGTVGTSGSQTVYPGYTTTYTLTVYGANGQSATCSTIVQANTYVPPTYHPPVYVPPVVQQPYVSLTQIPYTGFDFGPIGNALYWVSLLSFAVAGAYLVVYFRGGALAFAGAMMPARKQFAPVVAPKAPILVEKEVALRAAEVKIAPIVASLKRAAGTIDSMAIVKSNDGSMPKIVINRS